MSDTSASALKNPKPLQTPFINRLLPSSTSQSQPTPQNMRDLLTAFSPSLDLFAITSGDGRIKIWDTVKGQVQTEFTDIVSEEDSIFAKRERGHLSVDYTCMKWFTSQPKKKRKLVCSLLVLGTGGGDVLALDVAAGQSKWRVTDCHAGRVSSVSFGRNGASIYTSGADGMVCEIDSLTGNMLGKFKASTKAISSMSVSADGKILATAAAQMKILNLADQKKIQKFSGHPGAVRCMIFTENGKYILSSAAGERYIAVWNVDGGKKQSASAVLAMEHPAVFLDSKYIDSEEVGDVGLYVLAISEAGVCYFWFGKNAEELRNAKPTKVSVTSEDSLSEIHRGSPAIFAASLQGIAKSASGQIFIASGLPVKPSFQKLLVHCGTDVKLSSSRDGFLLPMSQSLGKSKRAHDIENRVVALDRANAEDALLPVPKIFDSHGKNKHEKLQFDKDEGMADVEDSRSLSGHVKSKDGTVELEVENGAIFMEDRLRSLGILSKVDEPTINSRLKSAAFKSINIQTNISQKKMRMAVMSMEPSDAYRLLGVLVAVWQTRSSCGNNVIPWIYSILVNHSHYVMSEEPQTQLLSSLFKVTKSRKAAIQPLLQLSGRLQLVMAQIGKAADTRNQILLHGEPNDESEDDEDEDEIHYREEDDSELSSDNEQ